MVNIRVWSLIISGETLKKVKFSPEMFSSCCGYLLRMTATRSPLNSRGVRSTPG